MSLDWYDWIILCGGIFSAALMLQQRAGLLEAWRNGADFAARRPIRGVDSLFGIGIFLAANMVIGVVFAMFAGADAIEDGALSSMSANQLLIFGAISIPAYFAAAIALIFVPKLGTPLDYGPPPLPAATSWRDFDDDEEEDEEEDEDGEEGHEEEAVEEVLESDLSDPDEQTNESPYRPPESNMGVQGSSKKEAAAELAEDTFGLNFQHFRPALLVSLAAFCILLPLCIIVGAFWQELLNTLGVPIPAQDLIETLDANRNHVVFLVFAIHAVFFVPVVEEMIFRGLLLPYLCKGGSALLAVVVVSVLFAAVHFNAAGFAALFVLAMGLGAVYIITRSLWAPILTHMLFNLYNVVNLWVHELPPPL